MTVLLELMTPFGPMELRVQSASSVCASTYRPGGSIEINHVAYRADCHFEIEDAGRVVWAHHAYALNLDRVDSPRYVGATGDHSTAAYKKLYHSLPVLVQARLAQQPALRWQAELELMAHQLVVNDRDIERVRKELDDLESEQTRLHQQILVTQALKYHAAKVAVEGKAS